MALPAVLQNLTLPVVASPMFIVSYPELVLAQCKAGFAARCARRGSSARSRR
jgi:NAD(P)H-dependent flavin oxidoreductase YrpB (nitropropane dioxygenase family)